MRLFIIFLTGGLLCLFLFSRLNHSTYDYLGSRRDKQSTNTNNGRLPWSAYTKTSPRLFGDKYLPKNDFPKFHLTSDKNEVAFGESLTLTWDALSPTDFAHTGTANDIPILQDDDVIALYCPSFEPDPMNYRDMVTIVQAGTSLLGQRNGRDKTNSWTVPLFQEVNEESCEFRLFVNKKSLANRKYKENVWLRPSTGPALIQVASTGTIRLTDSKRTPYSIHLSLTGNPSEMVVQFTTRVSGKPVVEISPDPEFLYDDSASLSSKRKLVSQSWTKYEGCTTTYTADEMCQAPANSTNDGNFVSPGNLHSVSITDLDPDRAYTYRVGLAAGQGIIWSDNLSFRSLPEVGSEGPFSFLAFANQGCPNCKKGRGSQSVADLIETLVEDGSIRVIHHFGGLSYAAGAASQWDSFMSLIEPYSSVVPLMVGIGDCEYDHTEGGGNGRDPSQVSSEGGFHPTWGNFGSDSGGECGIPVVKRFAVPQNGNSVFWYSYDTSLVHTVMLSSEHNMTAGSPQYSWLEKDLSMVDRTLTPWLVVELNRPLYNSESYWENNSVGLAMRAEIETLLYDYNVDVVLAGHYNAYLRTCDGLYQGQCDSGGPIHITVGTAGAGLDSDFILYENAWTKAFDNSTFGVGRGTAYNSSFFHWEFVAVSGEVIDDVWLKRER